MFLLGLRGVGIVRATVGVWSLVTSEVAEQKYDQGAGMRGCKAADCL